MTALHQIQAPAMLFLMVAVPSIVLGGPISLLAGTLLRVGGRTTSRARFAVWYVTLLSIMFVPLASWLPMLAENTDVPKAPIRHSLLSIPASWAFGIFALWSLLAGIAILRLAFGLAELRNLRRRCTTVERAFLDPIIQDTIRESSFGRRVEILLSHQLKVPTAIGFFKPAVILPAWVFQELSPVELRPVLLHELAHLNRWDDWTNLLQKIIKALLFFHPAIWWIEKNLSLEREMACDDAVLVHTANPRAYAESLVSIAEKSFGRRGLSLAQAAVDRVRQTSVRILRILDADRPATTNRWSPALLVLAASVAMGFLVVPRVPTFIGFDPPAKTLQSFSANPAVTSKTAPQAAASREVALSDVHFKPIRNKDSFNISHKGTAAGVSSARISNATIPNGQLIPVRFPVNENSASSVALPDASPDFTKVRVVQTTYFVVRPGRDYDPPEVVTVRVWQMTVFHYDRPAETVPAKKV